MAREKITEEILKDGSIKVTAVFLASARDKSPISVKGFIKGYAKGFQPTEKGATINIVYGWYGQERKQEQAPAVVPQESLAL